MDLTSQVRNHEMTLRHTRPTMPHLKTQDKTENAHTRALQILSNGSLEVPYSETLRMVTVEGDKQPLMPARVTQKHPGYTRNQLGAPFTS
mmetsp:Transcript_17097/g.51297  ORF Transcript_17097/g.51297 Transcript_17097/m.51297 type:complete len:90 (-) Transcript_17097:852-1121(-)